jgi:hypothetical protein
VLATALGAAVAFMVGVITVRQKSKADRKHGIRTATDLLAAFPAEEMESKSDRTGSTRASAAAAADLDGDATTVRNLVRIVARQPELAYVRNWKSGSPVYATVTARGDVRDE